MQKWLKNHLFRKKIRLKISILKRKRKSMNYTEKILCTRSHEYLLENSDQTYTIGLTDYAVEQLGDIVFLELPEVGAEYKKGESFAAIESVKAASEIYMPISGKIIEINDAVVDSPELLNEDNYEKGWLVKIESSAGDAEMTDLMEYEDYKEQL